MFDATIPWPCAGVGDSGRPFWWGCFWLLLLGWLFLALICKLAVYSLLLALLFLVIVLGRLLLAVVAGVVVMVLDPGMSDSWARCWGACAWFALLACLFLVCCARLIFPDSSC